MVAAVMEMAGAVFVSCRAGAGGRCFLAWRLAGAVIFEGTPDWRLCACVGG